jgi:hypothetical protein
MSAPGGKPATWRKASASNGSSGNCVEVAKLSEEVIAVRDSKDPDGPQLLFTSAEWRAFADGMAKGEFDYLLAALPADRHTAL